MKIKDLILQDIISHNETIALWRKDDPHSDTEFWHGAFYECPEEYLELTLDKIFGVIVENIYESDWINIRVKEDSVPIIIDRQKQPKDIDFYELLEECYTV